MSSGFLPSSLRPALERTAFRSRRNSRTARVLTLPSGKQEE